MTDRNSQSNGGTGTNNNFSRRTFLQTSAATGALAVGLGSGLTGNVAANLESFDDLSVSSDNRIVNESGETFKMRGLNIPDPKRMAITKNIRGKNSAQLINMITNNEQGWHPRVIRIPAQPTDIGEHPNGNTGPKYGEDAQPVQEGDFPASRAKQRPPQPQAFTQEQLDSYLENYYDDVVQQCKDRGVYCIIDFHRHWHEQPPGNGEGNGGPEGEANAENHLPYDSEYTLYWAYNEKYGKEKPASWGWVDQTFRNEYSGSYVPESELSSGNTPYDQWAVNQDLVDEAVMFWDTVAKRYADEPHVIFEPYNEPTAPGIWGPVESCGAWKQQPLWETFRKDFAQPIMEQIREHAPDKLMLMGLPGWCQATQALHWGGFDEEGFEDVAAVWHNYAGHGVSAEENWLNEKATGCQGWEPVESQGLQNAMDVHPIAVTEFGWQDPGYTEENIKGSVNISKWLKGSTTGKGTTDEYGKPFLDAMETDDRISWVAWCADPRWLTAMFRVDFPINETTFSLTNGSWYDTPKSEYPVQCEELPCDWALWQDPNMGQHVKDRLASTKDDKVPFNTVTHGPGEEPPTTEPPTTEPPTTEPPDPGETPTWPEGATDPDGDGDYEDLNGNGRLDSDDVVQAFENKDSEQMQANSKFYDFNGNGRIDFDDIVSLFKES